MSMQLEPVSAGQIVCRPSHDSGRSQANPLAFLHTVPAARGRTSQTPSAEHTPRPQSVSRALQLRGVPTHKPKPSHRSSTVHAFPSVQADPALAAAVTHLPWLQREVTQGLEETQSLSERHSHTKIPRHAPFTHVSFCVQATPSSQGTLFASRTSGPQNIVLPEQYSAGSQGPAEGRQTTLEAANLQVELLQHGAKLVRLPSSERTFRSQSSPASRIPFPQMALLGFEDPVV